ncbi:MAG: DPP IV N-terminal domain-containing protein [Bryobacterales bacterium]|nr:DPP IV N-terminal domain-containing protein [Bryobacterales bacterium]
MAVLRLLPLLLLAVPAFAQRKPVDLDAVTATREAPQGGGAIVWSPDSRRLVHREKEAIWLYTVATGERRSLLPLADLRKLAVEVPAPARFQWENRRIAEQPVAWTPGGTQLLVAEGGDLFLVTVDGGKVEQLTKTAVAERDPKLSPDGRHVAFRRGYDLYALELDSRKVTRLTEGGSEALRNGMPDWVYPEELGLGTAYWWSPDSGSIAYLQFDVSREPLFPHANWSGLRAIAEPQRYPKAGDPNADVRLGVVPAAGGQTRWIDLGDTRGHLLARTAWLPDSRGLAVQRLNRIQNRLDLLRADAATGESRLVLREEDRYWVNLGDVWHAFADGKRFLWSSERSGFRHLYMGRFEDGKLTQLTRGEWEVTSVEGIDEQRGTIDFMATAESPLERHLYRFDLGSRRWRKLTPEPGTHAVSRAPDGGHWIGTYSSQTEPPRRTLHDREGRPVRVFQEPDRAVLDEYEILPQEIAPLRTPDGTQLYARLIRPAGFDPSRKYPAVVIVYGGPHAQNVRNVWSGLSWEQALAHRGFVVWQVDNRGTAGRGHAFETPVFRNLGAQELADQRAGVAHLTGLGFVDPERIGVYGWSYGGYMTLYALTHAPKLFRAGIAGAPVTHWRNLRHDLHRALHGAASRKQ